MIHLKGQVGMKRKKNVILVEFSFFSFLIFFFDKLCVRNVVHRGDCVEYKVNY